MKKIFAALCTLMLVPTLALANSDMVSVSELRQQVEAMGRWTKTYEAYGRMIEVDIPIYIPNEKELAVYDCSAYTDYIKNPKPNGYRSYHMIIEIPVFFSDSKKPIRVEVQIRTIAMDFWASLDHQLKYKKSFVDLNGEISGELKQCADVIAQTDNKMLEIRKRIEAQGVTVSRD